MPVELKITRHGNREVEVDAAQTKMWTDALLILGERFTDFCTELTRTAEIEVSAARQTFDFTVAAAARRLAEQRVNQIREDERYVRENFQGAQSCPRCKHLVYRTSGCDHIACVCGHHFCLISKKTTSDNEKETTGDSDRRRRLGYGSCANNGGDGTGVSPSSDPETNGVESPSSDPKTSGSAGTGVSLAAIAILICFTFCVEN